MPEQYPDDATLLAITEDPSTGVEYIPTGQSPYIISFRRLVQRALLAAGRANDFRVYQDSDLSIGVRPGRCYVGETIVDYPGASGIVLPNNATIHVWVDVAGVIQSSALGYPVDRTSFVPLAEVLTGAITITTITDLRGEGYLHIPNLSSLGVNATGAEITQALVGIGSTVDASALNQLTAGPGSTADSEHRHLQVRQTADAEAIFNLINDDSGPNTNVGLVFSLPNRLPSDTVIVPNTSNGYLSQKYNGVSYNLVGAVHMQYSHEGSLAASEAGKLIGAVPVDGIVSHVMLSLGSNLDTDTAVDSIRATVSINGISVTSTDPEIRDSDGVGFRSTAQGDGIASVVKSDGTAVVRRGDIVTVDLVRNVSGVVISEASDAVVLVVVRSDGPE